MFSGSKVLLEFQLPPQLADSDTPVRSISLCSLNLTALYYMHLLALTQEVDLSHNSLTERCLPALASLQHCTRLVLDHNKLTSLQGLPRLPVLCTLSVRNNQLSAMSGLVLSQLQQAQLSALYEFHLENNPCADLPELHQFISELAKRK
jgi:Leucine-rich repeat (LRR) protein